MFIKHLNSIFPQASDSGIPSLSDSEFVTINILDVNDNIPEFTELQYRVNFETPVEPGVSVSSLIVWYGAFWECLMLPLFTKGNQIQII